MFGNFELLSLLGRGGMAEVYRARIRLGRDAGREVAIKRLLPEMRDNVQAQELFRTEAMLSQLVDHPNIVGVIGSGARDGQPFIVMELIEGRDLAHIVARCRELGLFLPVDFVVFTIRTLLEALGSAHDATTPAGRPLGIVHCDVSPSNVFISRVGEVKLGDFGVARARRCEGQDGGWITGKPNYVSPEAIDGDVTPQSDLWAAAVVLYEMLTLECPFDAQDNEATFAAIRRRDWKRPRRIRSDVPKQLEAVLERAFARKVEDRFRTAGEFIAALEPVYDERIGTPLGIAAVVRGLFESASRSAA